MTIQDLERNNLSLHAWISSCLVPMTLVLIGLLILIKWLITDTQYQAQTAVIFAFSSVFYILVRGGHMMMIRSLHEDMKTTYGKAYEDRLADLPDHIRHRNLGFTLARMKRNLIDANTPKKTPDI